MAGQITTKTFSGGMNKDLDFSLLKDNQYFDALNYKLNADQDSNGYILENAEGNKLWLDLSDISELDTTFQLIGHCYVQPYLTLFLTTNSTTRTPSALQRSAIVRITLDKDEKQQAIVIYDDDTKTNKLDFSATYPISAVGYYEAPDNIKVYWTDNYNSLRSINIMDDDLSTYSVGMLDLIPDFPIDDASKIRPRFNSYITGTITSCSVQYAYQYYIKNGPATLYSPGSKMIQMPVFDSLTGAKIIGGELGDETSYGVAIDITIPPNNLFDRLRVVRLEYTEYNDTPSVIICDERTITPGEENTIQIHEIGDVISELVYDDFVIQANDVFKAKTLEIKNNYLFAGNITEDTFDVDIDCRAYRFNASYLARLYEEDLTSYYEVDALGTWTSSGLDGISGSSWSIPDSADCINLFNNSNNTSTDDEYSNQYMFQADGVTRGATGDNITISFDTSSEEMDTYGTTSNGTWASSETLYLPGERSFQRNEVYRIGVIFRNEKLQSSSVKWVGDIKTPSCYENSNAYDISYDSSGTVYRKRLGINVNFYGDLSSIGATTWEVVYVQKTDSDRSILGQGLLQPSLYFNDTTEYYMTSGEMIPELLPSTSTSDTSYSVNIMRFLSPEIAFNKNLELKETDFFQYIGYFGWDDTSNRSTGTGVVFNKIWDFTGVGDMSSSYKVSIDDGRIVSYTTESGYRISVGDKSYSPYCTLEPDSIVALDGGPNTTHFVCSWDGTSPGFPSTDDSKLAVVNYKRNVFLSQYGGITYEARQNNTYSPLSDQSTSTSLTTYEGDTFIDWFWYLNVCNDLEADSTETEAYSVLFPCESSISLGHRLDDGIWRNSDSIDSKLVQEIAGDWSSDSIDTYTRSWEQDVALYTYNSVYSQISKSEIFIADSPSFEVDSAYPIRIKRSEQKVNNETLDSFTQFKPDNFIDLNGNNGEINNLLVFKDQLFFWQNSGFGVASVNTRSLIQDDNTGVLALGTGDLLDRYDYISDTIGNQSQFGITKSHTALYWGDTNKNELFKYDGNLKSETKLKGIQTWINSKGRMGEIKLAFDQKYNDIIYTITFGRKLLCDSVSGEYASTFTITPSGLDEDSDYNVKVNGRYPSDSINSTYNVLTNISGWELSLPPYGDLDTIFYASVDNDSTQTYTVTYNELINEGRGGWVSRNSFVPGRYIELDTNYLSTNDYLTLYKHNDMDANRCTYYGTVYDSELTTIFNKDYQYTKVWDVLKWDSEALDDNKVNQFKDTFETVTFYNDYQSTGDREVYYRGASTPSTRPLEVGRRDRTWSTQIPRNIIDVNVSDNPDITDSDNWDESQQFKERMRSKWLAINVTYDNTNSYNYSIPFISSVFRKSIR